MENIKEIILKYRLCFMIWEKYWEIRNITIETITNLLFTRKIKIYDSQGNENKHITLRVS